MIRLSGRRQCLRAADQLARSGAFGMLVIDLGGCLDLPLAAQTRLAGQALAHGTLILCLTRRPRMSRRWDRSSRSAHAQRIRRGDGRFACRVHVLKDKRRGPGWSDEVWCVDRMACVELPEFPLQLLLKRHPDWAGRPVAVVDRDKPQGVILRVNEQARAAASHRDALQRRPVAGPRPARRRGAARRGRAGRHGDQRAPAPIQSRRGAVPREPGVFWLNASGLSYLHASLAGGRRRSSRRSGCAAFEAAVAVGFTRFGTYAIARTLTCDEPVVVIPDRAVERRLADGCG